MASFPGHDLASQPPIMREVTSRLRDGYDYRHHNSESGNAVAEMVSTEFAEWFGIAGSASEVLDRLATLTALGVEYLNFASLDPAERETLAASVFPELRSTASSVGRPS